MFQRLSCKISGFSVIRHGQRFGYPFLEAYRSLLPLVDELVINVGIGEDATKEILTRWAQQEGNGKVILFNSEWPLNDPEKKKGGQILADQTNLALDRCSGDWCIYLQADEVLHDQDLWKLYSDIQYAHTRPEIEALLLQYRHFYGSFDVVQSGRNVYRREIRVVRKLSQPRSIGDAQSFRKMTGEKLKALLTDVRVFHYGWVRPPEVMREKTFFMDQLYHGDPTKEASQTLQPHSGENYRYKRILGLTYFKETHPKVMHPRISQQGLPWDFEKDRPVWEWKDGAKFLLDLFEKWTGYRLFEYRSYRLLKTSSQSRAITTDLPPDASVILSTYETPTFLELVLTALENQSYLNFELIICDDGSGPHTRQIIETFQKQAPFKIIHLWQENKGFRKCRILNEGIRKSCARTLIFLDGDCIPHRHFVKDHLQMQQEKTYLAGRRVELGIQLTQALTPQEIRKGILNFPGWKLIRSLFAHDLSYLHRSIRVNSPFLRRLFKMNRVVDLKGCNFSVSREALIAVNGFNEEYEGYGREDTDLELRLQNLGFQIKSIKGVALQFHLWHPRREFTSQNEDRLETVRKTRQVRCQQGLFSEETPKQSP